MEKQPKSIKDHSKEKGNQNGDENKERRRRRTDEVTKIPLEYKYTKMMF
jgi:hypothetical protein